ncbi:hypothetical protein K466DRAFT_343873 [Polyporus arcularius HHB13444]|uniref:Secreted protein n=1 Tax=Polyporus arcularius HHB13444 TaxID=1314778 RepID=A0A5C3NW62_9APHY|nr:hypothetical protein K466DRAFT_343873 [Polyporus arcularius HHB13444]
MPTSWARTLRLLAWWAAMRRGWWPSFVMRVPEISDPRRRQMSLQSHSPMPTTPPCRSQEGSRCRLQQAARRSGHCYRLKGQQFEENVNLKSSAMPSNASKVFSGPCWSSATCENAVRKRHTFENQGVLVPTRKQWCKFGGVMMHQRVQGKDCAGVVIPLPRYRQTVLRYLDCAICSLAILSLF